MKLSDSHLGDAKWQLRVLDGPLRGAVVVLGRRAGLGRSPAADLQLVADGVSRQHAMIAQDDQEQHVLIDLASVNGTWVDGERVDRYVLKAGTVFAIAHTPIIYERVPPPPNMRATAQLDAVSELEPATDATSVEALEEHVPTVGPDPSAEPESEAALDHEVLAGEVLAGPEGQAISFEGPDGQTFGGQLIEDIIEYRRLRSLHLRGGLATGAQRDHFATLQQRLRQPPAPPPVSQRAFCRFSCWFPASIRTSDGSEQPCWVRDFGVDGAQLKLDDHQLKRQRVVWLALHLLYDGVGRSEILTARVVWTDEEFVGLAFTGPPRSDRGRYTLGPQLPEQFHDTQPISLDEPE